MEERYVKLDEVIGICMEYCPDDDGSIGNDGDPREMLDEIENLPYEDVAPVVHAHWEESTDGWVMCSSCGHEQPLIGARYCPYCGCRMDEVAE